MYARGDRSITYTTHGEQANHQEDVGAQSSSLMYRAQRRPWKRSTGLNNCQTEHVELDDRQTEHRAQGKCTTTTRSKRLKGSAEEGEQDVDEIKDESMMLLNEIKWLMLN